MAMGFPTDQIFFVNCNFHAFVSLNCNFKKRCIYLEDRVTEKGEGKEVFLVLFYSLDWLLCLKLGQAKARTQLGLSHGWQEPKYLGSLLPLSQAC